MKPYIANLLNAIVLIAVSLWGYFSVPEGQEASFTALIPAAFGLVFLLCTPMMKKDNKVVAHIVVLLTFLLILSLAMPLKSQIGKGDTMGIIRVGLMMLTSIIAMITFIKSFIDARKAKNA